MSAAPPLQIDRAARTLHLAGRPVALTRREFELLARLALDAGRVVTKHELLRDVWCRGPGSRTLDRHVHSLRAKLGPAAGALVTVWGVGYRLEPHALPASARH
jgi:DNA-binding response OmpR family regulator